MRRSCRGSFTVEASLIVPVIFMIFILLMDTIFYCHDKNIMAGAAYETTVVGTERNIYDESVLENYFQSRVRGKLILFSHVQAEIQVEKDCVRVQCTARKKRMKICVEMSARRTEPEKYIRDIRKIRR